MPRDNKPPAFMFYVDDFSSDDKVEAMSTEAVGCYILLLCKAWRASPPATIPNDDRLLARWSRVSEQRWIELRSEVLAPFALGSDGRFVQKRMRREYDKQRARAARHSTSGKLGAAKRWSTHGDANGDANSHAMATEYESESEDVVEDGSSDVIPVVPKKPRARFVPPTAEEVSAYCKERGNGIDGEEFVSWYGSKNWMIGKNKMSNWKLAIVTWEKNKAKQVSEETRNDPLPRLGGKQ